MNLLIEMRHAERDARKRMAAAGKFLAAGMPWEAQAARIEAAAHIERGRRLARESGDLEAERRFVALDDENEAQSEGRAA